MLEPEAPGEAERHREQWVLAWRGPTPLRVMRAVGTIYWVLVGLFLLVAQVSLLAVTHEKGLKACLAGGPICFLGTAFFAWVGWQGIGVEKERWTDFVWRLEVGPIARNLRMWIRGYLAWPRDWRPGERVCAGSLYSFKQELWGSWGWGLWGVFFAGMVAVVLWPDGTSPWILAFVAAGGPPGALIAALVRAWRSPPHSVELLWSERRVRLVSFGRSRAIPFERIRCVVLQGRLKRRAPPRPPSRNLSLELSLELDDGARLLLCTLTPVEPPPAEEAALKTQGLPAAVDLARALDVPWRWREFL